MQIFKCVKLKAQNLIEFVFILPILILITLAIFETALFWQDYNAVNNLSNEINANLALIDPKTMSQSGVCKAQSAAEKILKLKAKMVSTNNPGFERKIIEGEEPFALYQYYSKNKVKDLNGVDNPQISLWVDCRNPFEKGFSTQIEFYHKTLIMKASLPNFGDSSPIVIIPDNVFIITPKLNTISHY